MRISLMVYVASPVAGSPPSPFDTLQVAPDSQLMPLPPTSAPSVPLPGLDIHSCTSSAMRPLSGKPVSTGTEAEFGEV